MNLKDTYKALEGAIQTLGWARGKFVCNSDHKGAMDLLDTLNRKLFDLQDKVKDSIEEKDKL